MGIVAGAVVGGMSAVEHEAMVVQQVWQWWFLTFELLLLHYPAPHTATCTAALILSSTPPTPSTQAAVAAPKLHFASRIHRHCRIEEGAG